MFTKGFKLYTTHSLAENRGVAFIELALTVPLLVMIIVGLVDYGFALREIQIVSDGAKQGARTASAHRQQIVNCSGPTTSIKCDGSGTALDILPSDAIDVVAKKATCSYLNNASTDQENWNIVTDVNPNLSEGGLVIPSVTVSIERKDDSPPCLFCWEGLFTGYMSNAQSTFVLESGRCL